MSSYEERMSQKYNLLGLNKTIRFSIDVLNPEFQREIKKD